ncbi:MAG: YgeY family selenium metabolism-linked hydrolase [Candidatus Wallbacteria bacterium]|nr:YgeY family selenium metabolism-linked hydrolase [Candidatus Wallbacteria bacterium]
MLDKDALHKQVKKYEKDITRFCRDIVRTPSFSCQEGALVEVISKEMKKCGFDEIKVDRMGNVIGRIGNGKTKIMIDAHIDTVGIGDPTAWSWDPFKGKFEDGKIYGRGATDQKGVMAAMVYGGKLIKDLKLDGDYTLYVVGSCQEEECDGLCIMHIVEKEKIRPDFMVLTEATDMKVYRGHRGRVELKVVTKGRSCHASCPPRGVNAIYRMTKIIDQIAKLDKKLKSPGFLGKGTVAVTKIECKTPSLNAVPDECTIYLDRRLTTGETKELAVQQILELPAVKDAQATVDILQYEAICYTGLKVKQEKYFPSWELPESHPLIQSAVEAATIALKKKPVVDKWIFGTNGSASMGRLGIPSVGFGAANEIYAHTTEEHIKVQDLLEAAVFYAAIPQLLLARVGKK